MSVPMEQPATAPRSERINLRVAPEVDALLREAATIRHKSLSAFLLDAACDEARATLEEQRRVLVRAETFDRLLDELECSGQIVEPLLDLIRRAAPPDFPAQEPRCETSQ